MNGNFETGSLSPWTTSASYASAITTTKHSGTYGLRISRYLYGRYYGSYIIQDDLDYDVDDLESAGISFWMYSPTRQITLTVKYSDATTDIFTFNACSSWTYRSVGSGSLDSGKTIEQITLTRIGSSRTTAYSYVDDVIIWH